MPARPLLVAVAALAAAAGCASPRPAPPGEPSTAPARAVPSAARPAPPEPELVQPGVVSTDREENFPAIDPADGSLWFSVYEGENFNRQTMMRAPREDGGWGAPAPVPLAGGEEWGGRAPRFSPDGRRLYFTSIRPVSPSATRPDMNIWTMVRRDGGWSAPSALPAPVNSDSLDLHAVVTAAGDLYLGSRRPGGMGRSDIYRIPRRGDAWGPAEHLGAPINDERSQPDLLLAPDGSWMVLVVTDHPQGLGGDDLFVSRRENGRWSAPEHLPAPINSAGYEYGPSLSPDGATLYFNSDRRGSADIYRVPASALGLGRR